MKRVANRFLIALSVFASVEIGPAVAEGVDPTPTPTPTATAQPKGPLCPATQACVSQQVSQVLQSCFAADASCTLKQSDRFALTAEDLANRAIASRNCTAELVTSKRQCNSCYQRAKKPLSLRASGVLFRGLVAQAVKIVEAKRVEACSGLKK